MPGTMLYALLPSRLHLAALTMLLVVTLPACAQEGSVQTPDTPTARNTPPPPPYRFEAPDTLIRLPNSLREISGLTVLDDETLGAVQDEKGKLYLLDLRTGEVKDDPRFDKDNDYEDLASVGDRVFVLRSNGTLYEITNWRAKKLDTDKHKTKLSEKHDTEGLTYDAARGRLLIACKEYAGPDLPDQKAIYAFDLATETLLDEPVYTINIAAFDEEAGSDGDLNDGIRKALAPAFDLSGFKPSALAIHPITEQLYVLSSVRRAIVVLTPDGALETVWMLPKKLFRQPESMTFLPDGTLFLASEGDGKKGTLMRYSYHP